MSKKNKSKNFGKYAVFVVAALVILDQITKYVVRENLFVFESIEIIQGVFSITFVQNTGAGFGILQNYNAVLLCISLIVAGGILFYWDSFKSRFEQICITLLLSGIFGNLIDRIALGYVVDFLYIAPWPAFNIADSAITIGILGLIYYEVKYE